MAGDNVTVPAAGVPVQADAPRPLTAMLVVGKPPPEMLTLPL
jgi:hypothetical protein